MENLVNSSFWRGKRVFLTGHTGFKGGWLALWLQQMGAEVTGYALAPDTTPALFAQADVGRHMRSVIGDIRDHAAIARAMAEARPEIVLHLAAQALVGEGYRDPLGTYATNVIGTANLLDCARHCPDLGSLVVVTTDKCYDNKEWQWPYRESDPLGGHDPYSSSKACAELVTASYRQSFLAELGVGVATARAGNVFGGGDWSAARLVPDLLAAFTAGTPCEIRRPDSIRPWQHVLEPLHGYLTLAEQLAGNPALAAAWNFGPADSDCVAAGTLASLFTKAWGDGAAWRSTNIDFPHEAGILKLDSSQAKSQLGWRPVWSLASAIEHSVSWHKAWLAGADMHETTLQQIQAFLKDANRDD